MRRAARARTPRARRAASRVRARTARPRPRTCPAPDVRPWRGGRACATWRTRARPPRPPPARSRPSPRSRRGSPARCAAPRSPIAYARTAPCDTCTPTSMPNCPGVERVEVLGERLPAPVDALGERGAGDVLHALHQADEPLLVAGAHGREPDAAVAGDDGGDTVTRRRLEQRVPRGLAVVVRVDVDEAGRDEQPGGVDGLRRVAVERRLRHRRRRRRPSPRRRRRSAVAPVPSTMVPLVILTSYMTSPPGSVQP